MGLIPDAFGPVAITDRRLLVKFPAGWSFTQAAAVPAVFLTAYYALMKLAQLKRGETLLGARSRRWRGDGGAANRGPHRR